MQVPDEVSGRDDNRVCDCRFHKQGTGTRIRNNVPMKGSHVFRVAIEKAKNGFRQEDQDSLMKVCWC
jgi:hypothetical protein